MIRPVLEPLRDKHRWLRVADAGWADPLDTDFARQHGGRWNPPNSHATLYLNENLDTARSQIYHMLEGSPVRPDDLDDQYVLVAATLPSRQIVADAVGDQALDSLGLPSSYPINSGGRTVGHNDCQPIGTAVKAADLRGIHARSAATHDGSGRELAWFPARTSSRATPQGEAIPFSTWFYQDSGVQKRRHMAGEPNIFRRRTPASPSLEAGAEPGDVGGLGGGVARGFDDDGGIG